MLSERDIELAHPEAFDFAFGNLPPASQASFGRHLSDCRSCQSVVEEYAEIGRIIKDLPPHVEPSADLEQRTVSAILAAMTEQAPQLKRRPDTQDRTATQVNRVPERRPSAQADTQPWSRPQLQHSAAPDPQINSPAEPAPPAAVRRLPVWRRYPRRFAAAASAVAAAVIAAIVVPLSVISGQVATTMPTIRVPLHATTVAKVNGLGAATGQVTAQQDTTTGSWHVSLTVHHLKNFGDTQWYECWYLSPKTKQVASAGTFLVSRSGNGKFPMTAAVDPRDFPVMEITLGRPSTNGAIAGKVVLRGTAKLL
jgi:hypothetical protein